MKDKNYFENVISGFIRNRLKEDKNFICIVVGETGIGKSSCALRLAELVDPNFDVDKVVFKPLDFIHLIRTVDRFSAIVFDEAGVGIPAREWQSIQNKILGYIGQLFRHKNLAVFLTVPSASFIDKQMRSLTHAYLHVYKRKTDKEVVVGHFYRYKHNPLIPEKSSFEPIINERGYYVDPVEIQRPSLLLWQKYLKKKEDFTNEFYKNMEEMLKDGKIAKDTLDGRSIRKLMNQSKALAKAYKILKDELGWSDREIAAKLGVNHQTLHNWKSEWENNIELFV